MYIKKWWSEQAYESKNIFGIALGIDAIFAFVLTDGKINLEYLLNLIQLIGTYLVISIPISVILYLFLKNTEQKIFGYTFKEVFDYFAIIFLIAPLVGRFV